MAYIVVNGGSTGFKMKVYNPHEVWAKEVKTAGEALMNIKFASNMWDIRGIGHRIVDGGDWADCHRIVTREFVYDGDLLELAPNHNIPALGLIKKIFEDEDCLADVSQVAVFDSKFHATMSCHTRTYPVPKYHDPGNQYRKKGFHGLACESAVAKYENYYGKKFNGVICHLGGGCSATAVVESHSVDTTMGISPLDGIVMGTRCGSIDPMVVLDMVKHNGLEFTEVILARESGMIYLTGLDKFDMVTATDLAADGDCDCQYAIESFHLSVAKAIGSMMASFRFHSSYHTRSHPSVIFTGGIGFNAQGFVRAVVNTLFGTSDTEISSSPDDVVRYYSSSTQFDVRAIKVDEEGVILGAMVNLLEDF